MLLLLFNQKYKLIGKILTSPADIIRQLLIDLNLVEIDSADDWPCFVSFFPDDPDEAACVYDTAGTPDGRIMVGERIEHRGIQIVIRGPVYPDLWTKADLIARTLDIQNRVTVAIESDASYIVHNVSRQGTILPAGIDEKDGRRRHYITINAVVTMAEEV